MKKKKAVHSEASSRPGNAPAAQRREKAAKRVVVIDYPLEGEIVTSPAYTIRLGAGSTDRVEISIDGKEWQPCRESVGYWWYDWTGYNAGPHSLVARVPAVSANRYAKSSPRQFTVLI